MKAESMLAIIAIVAILTLGGVLAFGLIYQKSLLHPQQKLITVSASGYASVHPSEGVVNLYITGSGPSSEEALSNLSVSLSMMNSSISEYIGGNTSNINTKGYQLYKEYNKTLYVARETVEITIPNATNMGSVLGVLSKINTVGVSSAMFEPSYGQIRNLTKAALEDAMQNATYQASVLADGAQVSPVNITSAYSYPPYPLLASASPSGTSYASPYPNTTLIFPSLYALKEEISATFSYQ